MTAVGDAASTADRWGHHTSHFGSFRGRADGDRLQVRPHECDPEPYDLIDNIASGVRHEARVTRPHVRRGWLERGAQSKDLRGRDEFVAVDWDVALDLLAGELRRVYGEFGAAGVFGGSYGWSSAGRFHHAQTQVHRFLNSLGGYVRSVNTYSSGASEVLMPHVAGSHDAVIKQINSWEDLAEHTELLVSFGGVASKNGAVNPGGITSHVQNGWLRKMASNGCRFVLVGPLRDDLLDEIEADWLTPLPGSDLALMIGLAGELVLQDLVDRDFVDRYCSGFAEFEDYLSGSTDGTAKDARWASKICRIEESDIRSLAHAMGTSATMITCSYSLQRIRHGEQMPWMALILAAMTGGIGRPGRGYAHGLGAMGGNGKREAVVPFPSFPQGVNECSDFIPVARIADMLLAPGADYEYNGEVRTYPDVKLVYWAGGNPFHHHQNLFRLQEAFRKPDTVVVHESAWTSTARHADIVLPATMSVERSDIGAARNDSHLMPMQQLIAPYGEARDDFDIFADLAGRLGTAATYTGGRTSDEWVRAMYEHWLGRMSDADMTAPDFESFWQDGPFEMVLRPIRRTLEEFVSDPVANKLNTRSGKIEIVSEVIREFDYDDCPPHPTWTAPVEWLGGRRAESFPIHLIANQPDGKLHSQLDFGSASTRHKRNGREVVRMHPADAAPRSLADGDLVRVWNDRGSCFATVEVTERVMRSVARLPTGAWFDPQVVGGLGTVCVHGNPNVLTADTGTSRLAQACTGQHVLVEITKWEDPVPPVQVHRPPTP
ncbi:molybdopterin-dependent oxidoreductase [Rhodococcus sovatensis]|uniref:Molybdopterin-dependent oxidoreductase n=1 Tax=Rhodococcus sovatensis TaxID=1805840 RepID=A0ABZ2PHV0_9NOCA